MTPVRLLAALAGLLAGAALARALGWGVGGLLPPGSASWDPRGLALAGAGELLALKGTIRLFPGGGARSSSHPPRRGG